MKQAILITTYKSFDHLKDIIDFFDDSFEVYIHIDRKSKLSKQTIAQLSASRKVKVISQRYTVNWGGLNHLKSYLLLAKEALKNPSICYFHLISGQDFPVKGLAYFKKFATQTKARDYMTFFEMPAACWDNGGMNRVEYYNLFDVFDAKKNGKWIQRFLNFQHKIHFKRPLSDSLPKLYGGDTWWSLTRSTLNYVVDYTQKNNRLIRRMKYTFCAEEIYFQTVIMNSLHAKNVVNENLRYIDWSSGRSSSPSSPASLDVSDWEKIHSSNVLFARKFESSISDELKRMLINQREQGVK